jgi:predicted pyridoxine 5'-phosphate oxidase superfamily flavin-nucleotide-binding protein
MATLPQNVQDLLRKGRNVWVATSARDGTPNIAIKDSGALLDEEHLFFADIFSKKTHENLLKNKRVAVAVYDADEDVVVQMKGEATFINEGPLFDKVSATIEGLQRGLPPVKSVIQIAGESVWDLSVGPKAGERIVRRHRQEGTRCPIQRA